MRAHRRPGTATDQAVNIAAWLHEEGFATSEAVAAARAQLEAAGLTHSRKQAISRAKLGTARAVLAEKVIRVCGDSCAQFARKSSPARQPLQSTRRTCEVCCGSNNRRAARLLAASLERSGVRRLLIVGGTGQLHRELDTLLEGSGTELRCIDGVERPPSKRDALADLNWADFMVVWASTPLPHKVSVLYTDECPPHLPRITVQRRGIEALCTDIVESLRRRSARQSATK